jgi:hypothetical protein
MVSTVQGTILNVLDIPASVPLFSAETADPPGKRSCAERKHFLVTMNTKVGAGPVRNFDNPERKSDREDCINP